MPIELDETLFMEIVDGSPGPEPGLHWFAVDISGVEKDLPGNIFTIEDFAAEENFPLEEPEHVYIELDPARRQTRSRLQTIVHPKPVEEGATGKARIPAQSRIYFYEATADVKEALRAQEAINIAVEDIVEKWTKVPFASGDMQIVTRHDRLLPTKEYVRQIFRTSPGFFGVPT